ncbi:hypothetical protein [Rhizobium sp. BG4]|uniref:hypothetical protein n=1 Tax=Rhizobium sp. BG4 TaxID=2613770 RepID=UPI00193E0528|nr:hypothetical protein [Rhizobium sp. BG4]QRM44605.1 hypothetical protein F2982_14830 [Rhizobium sp. BG4]
MFTINSGSKCMQAVLDECREQSANALTDIAQSAAAYAQSQPEGGHRPAYQAYERTVLDEALAAAEARPDLEHEIWSVLTFVMGELNRQLEALDAPPFRIISFEAFGEWLDWRASTTEVPDGFAAGPIPLRHHLN